MGRFTTLLAGTDKRIAVTRTLAPALWAIIVAGAADWLGLDVVHELSDLLNVSEMKVAVIGTHVVFAVLYLLGKFRPGWVERILLLVPVGSTQYAAKDSSALGAEWLSPERQAVSSKVAEPFPNEEQWDQAREHEREWTDALMRDSERGKL